MSELTDGELATVGWVSPPSRTDSHRRMTMAALTTYTRSVGPGLRPTFGLRIHLADGRSMRVHLTRRQARDLCDAVADWPAMLDDAERRTAE